MTDPRVALRSALGEWVRLRAATRAHATKLAAAEYALTRDARTDDDRERGLLGAQVVAQRAELEAVGRELDIRIEALAAQCAALDVDYRAILVDGAALPRAGSDGRTRADLHTPDRGA